MIAAARGLARLSVAAALLLSANTLTWLGIPYVADGGSLVVKLHPATLLAGLAWLLRVAACRSPQDALWRMVARDPLPCLAVAAIGTCALLQLALTGGDNLAVLLDSFLPAGLLAMLLSEASGRDRLPFRRLLQCGLAANAVLAVLEGLLHATLVPLYLRGVAYVPTPDDFRPVALADHPLTGAAMTLLGLFLAPTPQAPRLRAAYVALLSLALLAFGGRTAIAAGALAVAVLWVRAAWRRLLCRGTRPHILLLLPAGMLAITVAAGIALSLGLGERIASHLFWDASADVRLQQWRVLDLLDTRQLTFGTSRAELLALLTPLRLSQGVEVIENFWLLMLVTLGLVGFPVFAAGLGCLLAWCGRQARGRAWPMVVCLTAVASASNSLGRKSTLLLLLVAGAASLTAEAVPARILGRRAAVLVPT